MDAPSVKAGFQGPEHDSRIRLVAESCRPWLFFHVNAFSNTQQYIQRERIVILKSLTVCSLVVSLSAFGQDTWPDIRGPERNYHASNSATLPNTWSVVTGENVLWRRPLPETGHSGIAIWKDKLFLTCFRTLKPEDNTTRGTWVSETVGLCLDSISGKLLWSCDLPGMRPNQVNGTFTDSTTPTPVTNGQHVWFVNAGGYMACYTVDGEEVWGRTFEVRTKHSAKQFQPFLDGTQLYYVMMRDRSDPRRRQQTARDYDKNSKAGWPWMFVRSFDALTGHPTGIMEQGISVHSKGALGTLDGQTVLLHARGGSHSPPETPYGLCLSLLNRSFNPVWERTGLSLEGTHYIDDRHVYSFGRNELFVLDLATGHDVKAIRIRGAGNYVAYDEESRAYAKSTDASSLVMRNLVTHRSNIGVGKYHFFMSGAPGVLGRVNLESDEVSFLQVPIQVKFDKGRKELSWKEFESGDETGSGFTVEGDKRRLSHGFGHISAATPVVLNDHIYFTTVLGTVYVIDAAAEIFDQDALVAVNDLGQPGDTWTLSPFSSANGRLYQRTSREIICIGRR